MGKHHPITGERLPRYVKLRKIKGTQQVRYRFNPPQKYIDFGVVKRTEWRDIRDCRAEAPALNEAIDKFNREGGCGPASFKSAPMNRLVDEYKHTTEWLTLSKSAMSNYNQGLKVLEEYTNYDKTPYRKIKVRHVKMWYDKVYKERGAWAANNMKAIASIVFNYAIDMDYTIFNPWSRVKSIKTPARKTRWTVTQIKLFLETAYSQYKWRSVGLVVHLAYELAQRPVDMCNLTWDNIDFESKSVKLLQRKTKTYIELPLSDSMIDVLQQQKADYEKYTNYVTPNTQPFRGSYRPITTTNMNKLFNDIKREAGLPEDLRVQDLRRTALTEMNEAAVPVTGMMSMSGHTNIASLKPYVVHSLESARKAQEMRFDLVKERDVDGHN